jgi:hypothetical protein
MAAHIREEDDRADRRDRTGVATGALVGSTLGLGLATTLAHPAMAALSTLGGALLGALAGKLIASRVSVDDWDPRASDRPWVGMHTPDDDSADTRPGQRA